MYCNKCGQKFDGSSHICKPVGQPSAAMPPADIRLCVARLRAALNGVISNPSIPINQSDAAQLMNETGDIALKYRCYENELV